MRIIDYGVAALHPLTPSSASASNFFVLSGASPISTIPFNKPLLAGQSVLQSFMCRPIAHLCNKPGKIRYMSHELFSNQAWDAYLNDCFSLGVILYSLLTGRPPFQHADPSDIAVRETGRCSGGAGDGRARARGVWRSGAEGVGNRRLAG